jgi:DTW domain-containing protein YfiP
VEPLELATRVLVYRHRVELHKPTNTGRLAALWLTNVEMRTFGGRHEPFDARELDDPARRVVVLFPSAGARPIEREARDSRPVTLVVPDADWRRAHKLAQREPALTTLPHACVPLDAPSAYRLRKHPDPRYLATFEGILRALGVLEGDAVRRRLEPAFAAFVERLLAARRGTSIG